MVPSAVGVLRVVPGVPLEHGVDDRLFADVGDERLAGGDSLEEAVHVPRHHAAADLEVEAPMRRVERRHRQDAHGAERAYRRLAIVGGVRVKVAPGEGQERGRIPRRPLIVRLPRATGALHVRVRRARRTSPVLGEKRSGE